MHPAPTDKMTNVTCGVARFTLAQIAVLWHNRELEPTGSDFTH